MFEDPARIDTRLDSRSISFENPTGARGSGGHASGGRKGAPAALIAPGETVVLADIAGPGRVRHIWMTFPRARPERMRALLLEGFYDGRSAPSISAPAMDFFGLPHGRATAYASALTAAQEGKGFNAYFPMPFGKRLRLQLTNHGPAPILLYYQVDYTLGAAEADEGRLHVSFRRENPTTLKRDFVICEGFKGPGRLVGCVVGIRRFHDDMLWYGEGEFKVYRDGDEALPTICGTGLEDYIGSAWGLGPHAAPYQGSPLHVGPKAADGAPAPQPDFVGFYRWHLPDPIVFNQALKATIQQIGALFVPEGAGDAARMADLATRHQLAGNGWIPAPGGHFALAERVDDYCATAFVYCREPQAVAPCDMAAAVADIGLREYETA
ncbi:glycoside hydrolase family 172 protein [Phenylobacterium sp.]|uniref:glycoside hydrolase family 172 protein n=1 Tax=Phenylobacterium sp. TaxID=1871053 RepID=UPI002DE5C72B|nr:glycoside hydrolase family 172 protein [Phenylobacterium sp.]